VLKRAKQQRKIRQRPAKLSVESTSFEEQNFSIAMHLVRRASLSSVSGAQELTRPDLGLATAMTASRIVIDRKTGL